MKCALISALPAMKGFILPKLTKTDFVKIALKVTALIGRRFFNMFDNDAINRTVYEVIAVENCVETYRKISSNFFVGVKKMRKREIRRCSGKSIFVGKQRKYFG